MKNSPEFWLRIADSFYRYPDYSGAADFVSVQHIAHTFGAAYSGGRLYSDTYGKGRSSKVSL